MLRGFMPPIVKKIVAEWRGWLISVDSKSPPYRSPLSTIYAAHIAEPEDAMAATIKYANVSDEHCAILVELSASQLKGLNVPDRKVRRLRCVGGIRADL